MSTPPSNALQSNEDAWRLERGHPYWYVLDVLQRQLQVSVRDARVAPRSRILDYGCGQQPYRHLFPDEVEYIGADLPSNSLASLALLPDGSLPVDSDSYDVVLSTQVLEHVVNPGLYLSESYRVLKSGGHLILSTHGLWPFHPYPMDYWRWTSDGLSRIAEAAGFRVVSRAGVMGLSAVGFQFLIDPMLARLPMRLFAWAGYLTNPILWMLDHMHSPASKLRNAGVIVMLCERP